MLEVDDELPAGARAELEWAKAHLEELRTDHNNSYVAIEGGKIIDSDTDGAAIDQRTRRPDESSRGVILWIGDGTERVLAELLAEEGVAAQTGAGPRPFSTPGVREDILRAFGSDQPRSIIHVLGTTDGMEDFLGNK